MSAESPEVQSSIAPKIVTAKQKKEIADQAFKQGNAKDALKSYHESLMYLLGLDKNALQNLAGSTQPKGDAKETKERSEVDEMLEKIYANMSACHMKQENWKRAMETADQALAKNENNHKALFRKGKALGELGFFEKAVKSLEEAKEKNPTDAAIIDAEIARLQVIENKRERVHKQKLKGFFTRDKKPAKVDA